MQTTTKQYKRSARLDSKERIALRKYVKSFDCKADAAESIGLSKVTLNAILAKGRGRSSSLDLIKSKINKVN